MRDCEICDRLLPPTDFMIELAAQRGMVYDEELRLREARLSNYIVDDLESSLMDLL